MDIFQESGERSSLALEFRRILNDNYEIGRVLGKGGFGITYAALDRSLQMPVAIKEYLPTAVAGRGTDRATVEPHGGKDANIFENGLMAFLKEGQTLAKFNHPNIVRVLAFFRDNGTGYLVMPFLEGRTLDRHIRDEGGRITPEEAAKYMLPVLDGLRSVHEAGFLHRDIKPQNIYLTDEGGVILIDFGAARITFGQESQSLSAVLTPGYAPFEQYYRKGNQGTWTDVYAAAATFYRAITGQRPPESPERNETDALVPAHEAVPSISPVVSDVLTRALAPRPEERTQTVEALYSELVAALGGATGEETVMVGTQQIGTAVITEGPETVLDTPGDETVLDTSPSAQQRATADSDSGSSSTTPTARLVMTARRPCTIHIDGEEVAQLSKGESRTFMLTPGSHQVAATGARGVSNETTVDLQAGEERQVVIRLDSGGTASSRPLAGAPAHASRGGSGFPKGLVFGGGAVILLAILLIAFWPRGGDDPFDDKEELLGLQSNQPEVAINQTPENTPPPEPPPNAGTGGGQVITIPYSGSGVLGPGDNTLQSGEYVDSYRFFGTGGQFVGAALSSDQFDTYFIIITPTGEQIEVDDFEGDTSLTINEGVLPLDGWYELMVTSYDAGETGTYFLEVYTE